MGFKLKSQSPVKQVKKPKTLQEYNKERFGSNTIQSQPMLSPSGKTEYKLTRNGKDITNTKAGRQHASNQRQTNMENRQDYETKHKPDIYIADPTGISSWGDAKRAVQHIGMMAESGNWKKDRLLKDVMDISGAIPGLGSGTRAAKGLSVIAKGSRAPRVVDAAGALMPKIKKVAGSYLPDKVSEKISEKKKVEPTAPKSGIKSNKSGQTPMKQEMIKRKDGSVSKRGLWDNVRDNIGSGKKPTKAMLKEGKKITKNKK